MRLRITGLIVVAMMLAMVPSVTAYAVDTAGQIDYEDGTPCDSLGWIISTDNLNRTYLEEPNYEEAYGDGGYIIWDYLITPRAETDDDYLLVTVTSPDGKWYGESTVQLKDVWDPDWVHYVVDLVVYEQEQPEVVDNTTTEDIRVIGTVSGSYIDTHESGDVYESITEVESTGNPAKRRYSYLEHKWTIDVTGGSKTNVTFYLEAYHSPSSDGDDYEFAYSTDDSNYIDMDTCRVTKTADDNTSQTYELPEETSGTVYIRVRDTDQTAGNRTLDTIHIDRMFIRSVLAPPSYGVTATIDEASQTVAPGEGTTYTVRVKNTGDLDASYSVAMSGTAVTDATIDVSPPSWNTGTLVPNAENVQTVTVSTNSSTPEDTYTLTATATCDQDAGVNDSATSDLVVSSATAMHIASIDMSSKIAGPNRNAIALVTIVAANGAPVGNAIVEGHWSGATSDTDSGLTDGASGEVALDSDKVRTAPAVFTFTVDDVSLAGWIYDYAANEVVPPSGTITVQ